MDNLKWLCDKTVSEIYTNNMRDLISRFNMSTYGLTFLMNEIVLNKRTSILEFGSGLSTILMANVIKKFSLQAKIISIEAEEEWVHRIRAKIVDMELSSIVTIVFAPLKNETTLGRNNKWYNIQEHLAVLRESAPYDMVLIDGPPAYHEDIALSRYTAIPFIKSLLANEFAIFLDDANRHGEKIIMEAWKRNFNFDFRTYGHRISLCRKGPFINSHPSYLNTRLISRLV